MSGESLTDVFPFNLWGSNSSSQNSNDPEDDKENVSPPPQTETETAPPRKIQVNPDDIYYDMSGDKHLIILNHHKFKKTKYFENSTPLTRNGTYKDSVRLRQVFQKLGFTVKEYNDLEYHEIVSVLNTINNTDHSATSCMAVAILTHGDVGGVVFAADRPYNLKIIVGSFDQHPNLRGKPKLFFVQACRGYTIDDGHRVSTDGQPRGYLLPSLCDTLILRACVEAFYSYRDDGGSWLIQELCKVISAHHHTMDILQMCTLTQNNVAVERASYHRTLLALCNKKEMPETTFTLTKLLKL